MKLRSLRIGASLRVKAQNKDRDTYQKFFRGVMNKWGIDSPTELSDEDKKKFFEDVDKGWQSDSED